MNRSFLGKGWSFPPAFFLEGKKVEIVAEEEDIGQSLIILLGTRPGERVMELDYGCNLDIMLYEPISITLITEIKDIIETAILYFEPRIDLTDIRINTLELNEGVVLIEIDYQVRSTNSRFNLVYRFYLDEGSVDRSSTQYALIREV